MDLTEINTPFGTLDDATKGALLLAHLRQEPIECADANGWMEVKEPMWVGYFKYRVRPAEPVIGHVKFSGPGPIYHSLHPVDGNAEYKVQVTMPTLGGEHISGVYTSPDGLQIVVELTE
jgi:hypothetical protein